MTHEGLYRYMRLMLGIICAPELYQRVIQHTLQGCEGVHNILDDIIIYGRSQTEHDERPERVLKRIQERGLSLNKEKCRFNTSELVFMGYVLSEKGVGPEDVKLEAVANARTPKTASEVRSFLRVVNYSGRFIPNLATIAKPLRQLTRKSVKFVWDEEHTKRLMS